MSSVKSPGLVDWLVAPFLALHLLVVLGAIPIEVFTPILGPSAYQIFLWALIVIAVLHLAEAIFAYRLARQKGLNALSWALQTFIIGFFALRHLMR